MYNVLIVGDVLVLTAAGVNEKKRLQFLIVSMYLLTDCHHSVLCTALYVNKVMSKNGCNLFSRSAVRCGSRGKYLGGRWQ